MTDTRTAIAEAVRAGAPIIVRPRNGRPYVIRTATETVLSSTVAPDHARREPDEDQRDEKGRGDGTLYSEGCC